MESGIEDELNIVVVVSAVENKLNCKYISRCFPQDVVWICSWRITYLILNNQDVSKVVVRSIV